MTPLKEAFRQSREQKNIDLVLPVWKGASLYVVVGELRPEGQRPDFFITQGPSPERRCITVAEKPELLAKVAWPKLEMTGAEILTFLPSQFEVLVVHDDGADYLAREHLDWYRHQPAKRRTGGSSLERCETRPAKPAQQRFSRPKRMCANLLMPSAARCSSPTRSGTVLPAAVHRRGRR